MDLFELANHLATVDRCIEFLFEMEMLNERFRCTLCGEDCELTEIVPEAEEMEEEPTGKQETNGGGELVDEDARARAAIAYSANEMHPSKARAALAASAVLAAVQSSGVGGKDHGQNVPNDEGDDESNDEDEDEDENPISVSAEDKFMW